MAKYPFSVASPPFSRRQLFAGGFIGAGGLVAAGCADTSSAPASTTSTQPAQSAFHYDTVDGVKLKVSPWLIQENKKKGSLDWILSGYPPSHGLEGFTSAVSANVDTSVRLMVSTTDVSYKIQAYRMGYYGGYGGRLIATSPTLPGVVQPPPHCRQRTRHGAVSVGYLVDGESQRVASRVLPVQIDLGQELATVDSLLYSRRRFKGCVGHHECVNHLSGL